MFTYPGLERENHVAVGTLHIPGRAIVLQTLGSPLAVSVMETSDTMWTVAERQWRELRM